MYICEKRMLRNFRKIVMLLCYLTAIGKDIVLSDMQ